jgi:hypothetical protein
VLQDEHSELKDEPLWLYGFRVSFDTSMVKLHSTRMILQGLLVSFDGTLESLNGSTMSISGSRVIIL